MKMIKQPTIPPMPKRPTFDARDTQYNIPIGTDYISRQALLDKFEPWLKVKDHNDGELNMLKAILYEIRFMRPAQPKMGKWIYHIDDLFPAESTMECNQCHAEQPLTCDDEFCPHCGADMREVTE